MDKNKATKIRRILRCWYETNKRSLPWRETTDPYKIWISEIILQQTRVKQGLDYYLRFVERFPDVKSLAAADEQEVLKYWQGLGYYSRSRHLHKAAKTIVEKHYGRFPLRYDELLSLAGIGVYTAAAICSFAYNQPYATIDGNIFRVLARLTANATPIDTEAGKKSFTETADDLLDKEAPGIHNQAIMEFGALLCTPKQPDCTHCPLTPYCEAYRHDIVTNFPVKQKKTKVTARYFNYFFVRNGARIYLQKRTEKDIWKNLYEFPLIETNREFTATELMETDAFKELFEGVVFEINSQKQQYKHILSHRIIHAAFYRVCIRSGESHRLRLCKKIVPDDLEHFPFSRLTELFLEENFNEE